MVIRVERICDLETFLINTLELFIRIFKITDKISDIRAKSFLNKLIIAVIVINISYLIVYFVVSN